MLLFQTIRDGHSITYTTLCSNKSRGIKKFARCWGEPWPLLVPPWLRRCDCRFISNMQNEFVRYTNLFFECKKVQFAHRMTCGAIHVGLKNLLLSPKQKKNSTHRSGNPLWLLGVYAPVGQKSFFKMSKNSEKKI
jgi:hypothetical protein